jgi:alpha-galactosidase
MTTPVTQPPGRIRLPGLDESARYRLRLLKPGHVPTSTRTLAHWLATADPDGPGLELPGRALATAGIQAPFLRPESLLLLLLRG